MDKVVDESIYDGFDDVEDLDELAEEQPEPEKEPEAKEAPPAVEEVEAKAEPESEPEPEAEQKEPELVLLKDGKTAIPYDVLANTRRERDEALRQLAEREEQQPTNVPGMEELEADRVEIEKALVEAREVEDDELIKALERSERLLNSSIEAKKEAYQYQARDQQAAEQELQSALDAHPATAQWQSDPNSPEWTKFKQLYQAQMQGDPDFQAMPPDQQIAEIAEIAARRLGVELPGKQVEKVSVAEQQAKARENGLTSLTGVPGSATPASTVKRPEDLGGMVEAVPTDPEELEAWLADGESW
jgi:hypothetical protein